MKPSKKKPQNRMTKPTQIESSPPTDPVLYQSSTLTSTSESRSSGLAWLSDAFSSLSIDQIESAYDEAGCDTFKTAGILGTHLELEQEEEYGRNTGPTASENSSQKKAKKVRLRHVAVSSGMVSSVIGKDYTGSHSESNDKIQRDVEEAEGFLCSMLGENSDLGMGVVRDILGVCSGDVRKALELLLELIDESYCCQNRERFVPAAKNSLNHSHIFHGKDCKNPPGCNILPKQFRDRTSSSRIVPLETEIGLSFERTERDTRPMEPTQSKPEIQKMVLESLFNVDEVPEIHTYASGNMDWRKIAKNLQNGQDCEFHSKHMSATKQKPKHGDGCYEFRKVAQQNSELHPMAVSATRQKPKCVKGDGYHEFRKVAQHNWDLMKSYYQRAAFEFLRGSRSHASCLAEKGKYYCNLARAEDERASLEIFGARNEAFKNTATIDLHGQHVKEGIGILKQHLLSFTYTPSVKYLRVITGCGEHGVGKGKMKRCVKSLATREKIEWSEENSGTIVLKIKGRKEYTFTESDGCEE